MKHTLCHHSCHHAWDNSIKPSAHIKPGDTVHLEMREASDGQVTRAATPVTIENLDPDRASPITGPIYIDGAEPGDALRVKILDLEASGWGWTANIPGFGLLADQFKSSALHIWDYDARSPSPVALGAGKIPLNPFIGTIGVAPAVQGPHSTIPPRRVGGNMDLQQIMAGAELILPVECKGALFSAGDPHAAQGDGEVCGTAIETPMNATLAFDVIKGQAPAFPQIITDAPSGTYIKRQEFLESKGYKITTGIGPDLMKGTRNAVMDMVDTISRDYKIDPVDAYMLSSVCEDLRISQVVDDPNWTVSFHFPRSVFE